jgi:hypothetical protein
MRHATTNASRRDEWKISNKQTADIRTLPVKKPWYQPFINETARKKRASALYVVDRFVDIQLMVRH